MKVTFQFAAVGLAAFFGVISAQEPGAARGARGRAAETWWVNKTDGGVYKPPNRPL